ncbi:hypothetical protein RZS08_27175, partial [Arthrospira platensis SPKY1]|nr:hypothetical protein [Arthrospira platensis SPKY1]
MSTIPGARPSRVGVASAAKMAVPQAPKLLQSLLRVRALRRSHKLWPPRYPVRVHYLWERRQPRRWRY